MIVVRLAKDFTKWYTTLLHTNPYKRNQKHTNSHEFNSKTMQHRQKTTTYVV